MAEFMLASTASQYDVPEARAVVGNATVYQVVSNTVKAAVWAIFAPGFPPVFA